MHKGLLLVAVAMLALTVPVLAQDAQDAEVGKQYEVTIANEREAGEWTGAFGSARVGSVTFQIPEGKVKERYRVTVTAIGTNQWTKQKQAACTFEQIDRDRKGECIGPQ